MFFGTAERAKQPRAVEGGPQPRHQPSPQPLLGFLADPRARWQCEGVLFLPFVLTQRVAPQTPALALGVVCRTCRSSPQGPLLTAQCPGRAVVDSGSVPPLLLPQTLQP